MASITLVLTSPNLTSAAIAVTAGKIIGVETDKPLRVTAKGGSQIWQTHDTKSAINLIPPNDTIYFIAEQSPTTIIYDLGS